MFYCDKCRVKWVKKEALQEERNCRREMLLDVLNHVGAFI